MQVLNGEQRNYRIRILDVRHRHRCDITQRYGQHAKNQVADACDVKCILRNLFSFRCHGTLYN